MKKIKYITAEAWLTGGLALLGILGTVFLSSLVAKPKVLFGRSLTAIEPSLFPLLVLVAMAVLACVLLYMLRGSLLARESKTFEEGALLRRWLERLDGESSGRRVRWSLDVDPMDLF